jgi:hypothetical protein
VRRVALSIALLVAGAALGVSAPPEPEPKSLGEVARRAREKREKEATATASKTPPPTFGNEDLAERKKAGTSNLSVPGGTEASAGAGAGTVSPRTGPTGAGSPSTAPQELAAAVTELAARKAELAKVEAELDAAKRVLSPFSTEYTQDPYRQQEASKRAQEAQQQIDLTRNELVEIEERVARLRKRVDLEGMGSDASRPSSASSSDPSTSTTTVPDP